MSPWHGSSLTPEIKRVQFTCFYCDSTLIELLISGSFIAVCSGIGEGKRTHTHDPGNTHSPVAAVFETAVLPFETACPLEVAALVLGSGDTEGPEARADAATSMALKRERVVLMLPLGGVLCV